MDPSQLIFIFFYFSFLFQNIFSIDTLTLNQSLSDNQTLISQDQRFELGFCSPGKSKNKYLGIWYKTIPDVIVWVANRNISLTDSHGVLSLNRDGTLVLVNGNGGVIWSSINTTSATINPIVKLLDTGNLVVQSDSDTDSENYIWQSFNIPGNTRLPGNLMGESLETGQKILITSWKNDDDPSPGDFVYTVEHHLLLAQLELANGTRKRYRTGPWNGIIFNGVNSLSNRVRGITNPKNKALVYFITETYDPSYINRVILTQKGSAERYDFNQTSNVWIHSYSVPDDANSCDIYGQCGANGICNLNQSPICRCLDRFVPKSEQEWKSFNWSGGCQKSNSSADCLDTGDTFIEIHDTKLPDLLKFQILENMNLSECEATCSRNCSCTAYANPFVNAPVTACLMWYGDLLDVREYPKEKNEQTFYARVPLSEIGTSSGSGKRGQRSRTIIIGVSTVLGIIASLAFICLGIAMKKRKKQRDRRKKEELELPLYEFSTIASTTNNFSSANLIGEGGFGLVYKGKLSTGQEVAVKRLSENSGQGIEEFRNEVTLIAKLQHRNLVRLLGCCIQGEERMLIYEYMQNNSLDHFIFDKTKRTQLSWSNRFGLILGIAIGLLYLHQDSRLKIIHRDLKTSNILLDNNLVPKISDFGLARIFGFDQDFEKTKRVIGTYGYMAPEYAIDGKISVKSDIFSMGVIILELISGKKNRSFSHPDHHHNLLGHAWLLWNEDRALEFMDSCLQDSFLDDQVKRCIHVGLLCVQKLSEDRPEMSSVNMLSNEGANLPHPKEPGYFIERSSSHDGIQASRREEFHSYDIKTITVLTAR